MVEQRHIAERMAATTEQLATVCFQAIQRPPRQNEQGRLPTTVAKCMLVWRMPAAKPKRSLTCSFQEVITSCQPKVAARAGTYSGHLKVA
eukprot:6213587-Pleurochrysis_carterae.AAC.2